MKTLVEIKFRVIEVYTDGSWSSNKPDFIGWAFIAPGLNHKAGTYENKPKSANAAWFAEMYAACEAIMWAEKVGCEKLTVYHDNNGVGCWADGKWKTKNQYTRKYAAWVNKKRETMSITFKKISGDNNPADALATAALGVNSAHRTK